VNALPIGLSEDCVLIRDVAKDAVVSFDDVDVPAGRRVDALWQEQFEKWPVSRQAPRQAAAEPALAGEVA
jgi:predicted homoserine dehydrogenase-like protein